MKSFEKLHRTNTKVLRACLAVVFLVVLVAGAFTLQSGDRSFRITAFFASAIGIYKGDEVKIAGVRVGRIESIKPQDGQVKIVMKLQSGVAVPADARALIVSPNLVSARFLQLAPTYIDGPVLPNGSVLDRRRTAVPVEWDEIKQQLAELSSELGPAKGDPTGPISALVNQAADTFDGNGDSFRRLVRELSQAAGRLGDSRGDIFGTVRNLQALVTTLANTNQQIVSFAGRLASVSKVLADSSTDLDTALGSLGQALKDVRDLLRDNNSTITAQVQKLADLTKLFSDQRDDVEQVLHVAPNGAANFLNIYSPAQGSLSGILSAPFFSNPVQFLCGSIEASGTPDSYRRGEICRQRMAPVLRRLTMNYPPLIFHPVNSITAYKGQIIYDSPLTQAKAETPIPEMQWVPAPGVSVPGGQNGVDLKTLLVPPGPPAGGPPAPGPVPPGPPLPAEAPGAGPGS